jgi:hypothetical protein
MRNPQHSVPAQGNYSRVGTTGGGTSAKKTCQCQHIGLQCGVFVILCVTVLMTVLITLVVVAEIERTDSPSNTAICPVLPNVTVSCPGQSTPGVGMHDDIFKSLFNQTSNLTTSTNVTHNYRTGVNVAYTQMYNTLRDHGSLIRVRNSNGDGGERNLTQCISYGDYVANLIKTNYYTVPEFVGCMWDCRLDLSTHTRVNGTTTRAAVVAYFTYLFELGMPNLADLPSTMPDPAGAWSDRRDYNLRDSSNAVVPSYMFAGAYKENHYTQLGSDLEEIKGTDIVIVEHEPNMIAGPDPMCVIDIRQSKFG